MENVRCLHRGCNMHSLFFFFFFLVLTCLTRLATERNGRAKNCKSEVEQSPAPVLPCFLPGLPCFLASMPAYSISCPQLLTSPKPSHRISGSKPLGLARKLVLQQVCGTSSRTEGRSSSHVQLAAHIAGHLLTPSSHGPVQITFLLDLDGTGIDGPK